MARVGILTGGGDCPGLNAVIRAVTRRALDLGWEVAAVREGWRGLVEGIVEPLERRDVSGILPRGGTILGTSRTNPYKVDGGVERVIGLAPSTKARLRPLLDALRKSEGQPVRKLIGSYRPPAIPPVERTRRSPRKRRT